MRKKILTTLVFVSLCASCESQTRYQTAEILLYLLNQNSGDPISPACQREFTTVPNETFPGGASDNTVDCAAVDRAIAVTTCKMDCSWFRVHGYQLFGTKGTAWSSPRPSAKIALGTLGLPSAVTVKTSSWADSTFSGGQISFLDAPGNVLATYNVPPRQRASQVLTVPGAATHLLFLAGDWANSVLILL